MCDKCAQRNISSVAAGKKRVRDWAMTRGSNLNLSLAHGFLLKTNGIWSYFYFFRESLMRSQRLICDVPVVLLNDIIRIIIARHWLDEKLLHMLSTKVIFLYKTDIWQCPTAHNVPAATALHTHNSFLIKVHNKRNCVVGNNHRFKIKLLFGHHQSNTVAAIL